MAKRARRGQVRRREALIRTAPVEIHRNEGRRRYSRRADWLRSSAVTQKIAVAAVDHRVTVPAQPDGRVAQRGIVPEVGGDTPSAEQHRRDLTMGRMARDAINRTDHKIEPFSTLGRETRVRGGYAFKHTPEPIGGCEAIWAIAIKRNDNRYGRNRFSMSQQHGINCRRPVTMTGIQSIRGGAHNRRIQEEWSLDYSTGSRGCRGQQHRCRVDFRCPVGDFVSCGAVGTRSEIVTPNAA